MQTVNISPEWYTSTLMKLKAIEENASDYEDLEYGDKAPSPEVFQAVRAFLDDLQKKGDKKLEQPNIFISPNGQILLTYGDKKRSIDIRFSPEIFFFFKHPEHELVTGSCVKEAITLVCSFFRIQ